MLKVAIKILVKVDDQDDIVSLMTLEKINKLFLSVGLIFNEQ